MRAGAVRTRYDNARNLAGVVRLRYDNPGSLAGFSRIRSQAGTVSAVVVAGCNARYIRPVKADIGQFAVGELGQLSNVALIIPKRPDHANEREQHGSLLQNR